MGLKAFSNLSHSFLSQISCQLPWVSWRSKHCCTVNRCVGQRISHGVFSNAAMPRDPLHVDDMAPAMHQHHDSAFRRGAILAHLRLCKPLYRTAGIIRGLGDGIVVRKRRASVTATSSTVIDDAWIECFALQRAFTVAE